MVYEILCAFLISLPPALLTVKLAGIFWDWLFKDSNNHNDS
ncbi:hypothetical protein [Streptomyces phage Psst4]|nr:hypothetical protein [Streptomyces phage Psst4]